MFLQWVELKNIRSYESCKIAFSPGTTLLSGAIGSGKSSILQSIEFALFGITTDLSGAGLLRNGSTQGSVTLCFELDGKEIIIERNLRRGSSGIAQKSGFLSIDKQAIELTAEELRARIFQLLQYPQKDVKKREDFLYRFTVYTPQEQMKQVIYEKPEQRLEIIRRIFGMDKYKTIRQNAAILQSQLKIDKRLLEQEVSSLPGKQEALAQRRALLETTTQRLQEERNRLATSQTELAERRRAQEACDLRIKATAADKQLFASKSLDAAQMAKDAQAAAQIAAQKAEEAQRLNREREQLLKEAPGDVREALAAKQEALTRITRELSVKDNEVKETTRLIQEHIAIEQRRSRMHDELTQARTKLAALRQALLSQETVQAKLAASDKAVQEARQVQAIEERAYRESSAILQDIGKLTTCPRCKQQVNEGHKAALYQEEHAKAEHAQARIAQAKSAEAASVSDGAACRTEITRLQALAIEAARLEQLIASHEKQLQELATADLKSLEARRDDALERSASLSEQLAFAQQSVRALQQQDAQRQQIVRIEAVIREREQQRAVEEANASLRAERIELLRKELEALRQRLETEPALLAEQQRVREQVAHSEQAVLASASAVAASEKEVSLLTQEARELRQETARLLARKGELSALERSLHWIDSVFLSLMQDIERHVMLSVYGEFNELFEEWFATLVGNPAMSARLDEEFTPVVEQAGEQIAIEHLSGGEKTSCALAYRLALNTVINDVMANMRTKDLLMLDEPTEGFSSEQLDKLREILEQLHMKQIIIVSHEPKIESFVDHIIRIEKHEGTSVRCG